MRPIPWAEHLVRIPRGCSFVSVGIRNLSNASVSGAWAVYLYTKNLKSKDIDHISRLSRKITIPDNSLDFSMVVTFLVTGMV